MTSGKCRRPVRVEGTVVFADGRTHLVRIFSGGFLQYAGTAEQWREAEPVLQALAAAFSAAIKEEERHD
ncbi:hypothetical protein [Amycolatopsis pittospori]|uniref:hypothetical protein n=1 Tax=Amycolatopsis pittospori TaxID=2749434 RepID=UPI0015F01059|nr:hypothetical protein [Amycolatopsis pittospori]